MSAIRAFSMASSQSPLTFYLYDCSVLSRNATSCADVSRILERLGAFGRPFSCVCMRRRFAFTNGRTLHVRPVYSDGRANDSHTIVTCNVAVLPLRSGCTHRATASFNQRPCKGRYKPFLLQPWPWVPPLPTSIDVKLVIECVGAGAGAGMALLGHKTN